MLKFTILALVIAVAHASSMTGGYSPQAVNDEVKELASWAAASFEDSKHTVVAITNYRTQIVAGVNHKFTLELLDGDKVTKSCEMSIFTQAWTNTRKFFEAPACKSAPTSVITGGYTPSAVNQEVKELASWAAASLGEKHTVVAITNYRTQVVAGVNHKFTLELLDDNKVTKSCEMSIFVQSWTNTREFFESPVCTGDRSGQFVAAEVDAKIKEIAAWSAVALSAEAKHSVVEITNVQRQVVNGINYKFTLTLNVEGQAAKSCDLSVYDQPWTNTRRFFETPRCTAAQNLAGGYKQTAVNQEVRELAAWAAASFEDSKHTVVAITNYRTQIVSGVNHKFTLELLDGNKVSKSCEMSIYTQAWTNTKKFFASPVCTASRAGSFAAAEVDAKIKEIAAWSAVALSTDAKHSVVEISNVQRQIVNGVNYKFTLTLNVEGEHVKSCELSVYDQAWTGIRRFFEAPRCTSIGVRSVAGGYKPTAVNQEVQELASWAAASFEDSKHTVVAITNYRTQIVSGVNHKFTLELLDGDKVTKSCEMSIYTQAWTNTRKFFEEPRCTASRAGQFVAAEVDAKIKEIAAWSAVALSTDAKHSVVEITNVQRQVVNGVNYKFTLTLNVEGKAAKSCELSVYDQAWTGVRRFFEAPRCTAARSIGGGMVGGFVDQPVVTAEAMEVAQWAAQTMSEQANAKFLASTGQVGNIQHTVHSVSNLSTQVVNGVNYKFSLEVTVSHPPSMAILKKTCMMDVYVNPWTNTRQFNRQPICSK